ncbi:MAG: ankyrin repeat domain-containing protein, partial [Brevinema sp.]
NNDSNMISYFAQMGANINAGAIASIMKTINGETTENIVSNWTALMGAAQLGNTEAAKVLIDYNADINATDSDGWTALLFAVQNNFKTMAEFLIRLGADFNIESKDKHTALSIAVDNQDEELIAYLNAIGATASSVPALNINEQVTSEDIEIEVELPAEEEEYSDEEDS